jgi:uncharacterized protein YbbC (DUF1343 family)
MAAAKLATACALLLGALAAGCAPAAVAPAAPATSGLDRLVEEGFASLRGKQVGVVTNQSGVDRRLRHIADLLRAAPGVRLQALFGPEHGVRGMAQAGAAVADALDPQTGVPVYSLYGERRKPICEQLRGLDCLLFDLQDVGVRTYTYLSTLVLCLEAAAECGVEIWVLDRPNPLGGVRVEGPVLEKAQESFVGCHPLPLRHGLTIGEFARLVNEERGIGARLRVVPLSGWRREPALSGAAGPWVAPSPNLPAPMSALLYAGFVLLEGTSLSEGRGTTRPFQLFGAPWLDAAAMVRALEAMDLPGGRFRATGFVPTFSKHQGEACQAVEVHVEDPEAFRPVLTACAALAAAARLHPGDFTFHAATFDRLAGTARLRESLMAGEDPRALERQWESGLEDYRRRVGPFLIYPGAAAGRHSIANE